MYCLIMELSRGGWYAIPFPETFSRHSGSCLILGDRNVVSNPLVIKTGDCFRLGSVGLVVSEMRLGGEVSSFFCRKFDLHFFDSIDY